jgi:hypothetical protein
MTFWPTFFVQRKSRYEENTTIVMGSAIGFIVLCAFAWPFILMATAAMKYVVKDRV